MDSEQKTIRSFFLFVWEVIKIVIISLAIVLPIRYFLIQPFFVKGMSMEPNFDDGQYLIIDEISYRFEAPQRGDVIVFRNPRNTSEYYIKRVVGLPKETIEVIGGGIIVYNDQHPNGFALDEKNYLGDLKTGHDLKVTLESNQYFVLGDNRSASSDSRSWGPLDKDKIVGRVWVRVWPFETAKVFAAPSY